VRVTARELTTGLARTATSDESGRYYLLALPPGDYIIEAEQTNGEIYRNPGVTLTIGQTAKLDLTFPPFVSEVVEVHDKPPVIDPTQSAGTTTVPQEKIAELPALRRNYLDFVLTVPGINPAPVAATTGEATPAKGGFSFGGLRPESNQIFIDGLENNDEFTGANRTQLSLETVREFEVVDHGLSAEFGGAAGGAINVVTRTGTNIFHGSLFSFLENERFNARELEPRSSESGRPRRRQYQLGFSLGGPIIKNQTFFYLAAEQTIERREQVATIDRSVAALLNGMPARGELSRFPVRGVTLGRFPSGSDETELSLKTNHQLNAGHSLLLRAAFTNTQERGDGVEIADPTARVQRFIRDSSLGFGLISLFGTREVNDLRAEVSERRAVSRSGERRGPGLIVPGQLLLGRQFDGIGRREEVHYQLFDTFTFVRGSQQLKIGGGINHVRLHTAIEDGFGGLAIFAAPADLTAVRPDLFVQAFGDPSIRFSVTRAAIFAQDRWQARTNLTFDAGLRYEVETLPSQFHKDYN